MINNLQVHGLETNSINYIINLLTILDKVHFKFCVYYLCVNICVYVCVC